MLGWIPIRGVRSSAELILGDSRGGVIGPRGVAGVGVAKRVGRGRRGDGFGNNCVCEGVRRQVAWITGSRTCWIRSREKNASRPLALAMSTNSTGHFTGERIC